MTRPLHLLAALCLGAVGASAAGTVAAQTPDPGDIVNRVDQLLRGNSSRGSVTMQVVTRQWSRALDLDIWSLGTDYALIRVTSPAREAGTATLKVKNDVWNYLPRVDRTIRIPPSLMAGAWMGSHFTNNDLVKESRLVDDYDITLDANAAAAPDSTPRASDAPAWTFRLTPKPDAAVVWGHIELRVRRSDFMPLWERFYDDAGQLARTITFSEFHVMGGRMVPARLTVTPADKPDEHTVLTYRSLEFNVGLTPAFFSLRNLKRR
ncbi:MAG TPA: outer membrane lipoprotein-sorting protein [Gemmatimonadaceae bacterium]|nr:outer membrane lipoprotein-sorting protein [Gemmatimonadaceae bacterium]